jgi:hypothetical protein
MIPTIWAIGFCASAVFYGVKRLQGVQPIPWPILMVNLIFWPIPPVIAAAACSTGRKP